MAWEIFVEEFFVHDTSIFFSIFLSTARGFFVNFFVHGTRNFSFFFVTVWVFSYMFTLYNTVNSCVLPIGGSNRWISMDSYARG
jgi:hypothetical protein